MSSISLVWAAEMQKRALDSMMGVAGKPTTTVPMFLFNISRPNALTSNGSVRHGQHTTLTDGLISAPQAAHIRMLCSLLCKTEIINSSVRFRSCLENEKQQDKPSEPEPVCHPDSPDYPSQLSLMLKALKTSDYVKRRGITHPILAGI